MPIGVGDGDLANFLGAITFSAGGEIHADQPFVVQAAAAEIEVPVYANHTAVAIVKILIKPEFLGFAGFRVQLESASAPAMPAGDKYAAILEQRRRDILIACAGVRM